MTHNDFLSLEYLARCSGWTEAPADKDRKSCPRFMGTSSYLIVRGFQKSVTQKFRDGTTHTFYRITAAGLEAFNAWAALPIQSAKQITA